MKTKTYIAFSGILVLALVFLNSCKRTGIGEPSPFGPASYSLLLNVSARPNVIFAGTSRESVAVRVTLQKFDGSAMAGQTVHFQIQDASGQRVNVGLFDGNLTAATRTTDASGSITLNYHGPLATELTADAQVYIFAILDWQGTDMISEFASLFIIHEATDVAFELYAIPNVLHCTSASPQSLIKAVFKKTDGTPLADRKVYFSILSGPGEFEDGKQKTYATTDSSGIARIYYIGPTGSEIAYDQFVQVRGQPETSTPFYIHTELDIRLIKGEN